MPVSAAFWIFLLIVMVIAFFMLLPKIKNVNLTEKTTETEQPDERREKREEGKKEDEGKAREEVTEEKKPQAEKPAEQTTAKPQTQPENKPQTEKPVTPAQPSTPPAQPATPPVKPVETRDRSIYLIQKSNMMPVKVNRNLSVSNTPLLDSINALLAGPTPDEIMRGMESLVPEGSRLISAKREGNTAILDFNQEFRYNTRGSEGCAAQIKQIVWTATEFPNIREVQFLIEGKKVDFLSEGVVISSPISRYAETAPR